MAHFVLTKEHSLADHILVEVRDKRIQQDSTRFRENVERLGSIMAYEISKKLDYQHVDTETPLGVAKGKRLKSSPILIALLRAGLPYFNGFQKFFSDSPAGFVGLMRVEGGSRPTIKMDYVATPHLKDRDVIIVDPMLATGLSVTNSIAEILRNGNPRHIHIATLIATQTGINHVENHVKTQHSIWTFAVDEKLDERFYIVPGLGDAGDLSFGEKV